MTTTTTEKGKTAEGHVWGDGGLFGNRVLGSLFLTLATPPAIVFFIGTCIYYDGSFRLLFKDIAQYGVVDLVQRQLPLTYNPYCWKMVLTFLAYQLFLMRVVPGKTFKATVTATGFVPTYTDNGVLCYLITAATLFGLAHYNIWNPADVYDNFGGLLVVSNILAFGLCVFLTIKGLYFPSTKDSGTNGNVIVDFFWGTELYPSIFGFSIKQVTNCRYGMMLWQMLLFCYAYKQYQLFGFLASSMIVSILIQTVYIFKFFLWETGYFCSMDIQHDRAGYYICWGCMMWVPSMYTIHTFYLTTHPVLLSLPAAVLLAATGVGFVWMNYDCDRQRQRFRASNGKEKIWGREPEFVAAEYVTADGKKHTSLLLASGWWGLARHFHYVPEIAASFCWCLPALFAHPLPYFYPVYLTILLVDRAWRDDLRCAEKYKQYWNQYCEKVPFKIFPGAV